MYNDDTRNPMKVTDVTIDTPHAIEYVHKMSAWYKSKNGFRPTSAYVVAIKPCGCTGPHLGSVETVQLPRPTEIKWAPPRTWKPEQHGYELRQEAKGRVGLYLNGKRLFGKLTYGAEGDKVLLGKMLRQLSYRHHQNAVVERNRPRNPDGRLCLALKEAMEFRPRGKAKLWAVLPERPYRSDLRKQKPVGYVWGMDAAAKALHAYWAAKNIADKRVAA